MEDRNVRISGTVHAALIQFITDNPKYKVGKFAEDAIMRAIDRERKITLIFEQDHESAPAVRL